MGAGVTTPQNTAAEYPKIVTSPSTTLRVWIALAFILLVGAGLRAAYLNELKSDPVFERPAIDAGYHDYWARALLSGDWTPRGLNYDPEIPRRPFFRPPGYPYFLAAVYAVFGADYLSARIAQMALGLGALVLLFLLGRRVFGPATGLVAAGLMATYWVFIHFEADFLDAGLLVFLTLAFLLVLAHLAYRDSWAPALAAGLLGGLVAVVRPTILAFLPVAAAWIVWAVPGPRHRWSKAGLFALGAALAIFPVTIRNARVAGEWVLISANGGINLLIGNNPRANGTIGDPILEPGVPFMNSDDFNVAVKAYERLWGRRTGYAEVSRHFSRQALRHMRDHPGRTFWLLGRKALMFWGPVELGHQRELAADRAHSRVLSRLPLTFPFLLALAVAGACMGPGARHEAAPSPPGRRANLLLILFVAVTFLSLLPFFITAQYRLPVLPLLCLWAGHGLVRLAGALRVRPRLAGLWLAVFFSTQALATVNWTGIEAEPERWHFSRARAFEQQGALEKAAAEYRRALEINPRYVDALVNLGGIEARAGRLREAERLFLRATAVKPSAQAWVNLGITRKLLGRRDAAREALDRALAINPMYEVAHHNLGIWFIEEGEPVSAEKQLRTAVAIRPNWPEAWINLALALRHQGRVDEAAACCDTFIRAYPELAERIAPLRAELAGPGPAPAP